MFTQQWLAEGGTDKQRILMVRMMRALRVGLPSR